MQVVWKSPTGPEVARPDDECDVKEGWAFSLYNDHYERRTNEDEGVEKKEEEEELALI